MVRPKQVPEKGDRVPTGEDATVERIGRRLSSRLGASPPGETWSGDDAAVVRFGGSTLLLSTDAVVEAVHVDLALVTLADVGWKALTVAVSDIAAMGGTPAHALVALGAPPETDLDALADGIAEAASRFGCPVVGGDLSAAAELVVAVAVTGTLEGAAPAVLRSGARPDDALYLTGPLGGSAAGLRLLREGAGGHGRESTTNRESTRNTALEDAYRRPMARLEEGRAARLGGASAMMDVSDGLGLDLHRLARASGVGFVLDNVPVADGATEAEALGGGEDYELLIAAPKEAALSERFAALGLRTPIPIGRCTEDPSQRRLRGEPLPATGYQHRL